ncbi:MAG: hypothetical protein WCD70_15760 [Alphaproteobacteria bacterium]
MSIIAKSANFGRQFFESPEPAGRKITAGFTYLQRISKTASFDVWFPDTLKRGLEARIAAKQAVGEAQFPAQWAAVRQFELLQESGNHKIYDLDSANLKRAALDLSRSMRAGGYRVTVATLGTYQETGTGDELEILDTRLQNRIAQMIHMLYLDTQSDDANAKIDEKLAAGAWDYRAQLPHIGCALGADDLLCPPKTRGRDHKQARAFFDTLGLLPQKHIAHDTVIGLQLPELKGVNQWNYIASPDETLAAFNRVLGDLFDGHTFHLRGYGDRLTESHDSFYRGAALSLH